MTPLEETLNKAMRDLIDTITGIPSFAIKAKQAAPRPGSAYCSVDVMLINSVGWEDTSITDRIADPDIDFKSEGYKEITYSLNFYKSGAIDNANMIHSALVRNSSIEYFSAANLGLNSRSDVRDISERLESKWEERAQFDVIISAVGTDEEIITSIEALTIAGEIQYRGEAQIPVIVET